jgi:hypothetical protein
MWMTDGMAHGLRPWFTKFNAKVPDSRWVAPIAETFRLHAKLEKELAPLHPTAEIALLDPSTTLRSWHPDDRESAEGHELGLYHALVEARLPFDLHSDLNVSAAALDRYKLIAVANASFLSMAQCKALTAYVERGGNLVAGFETSLYDEWGKRRADFGLAALFGASVAGETTAPAKNTYIALDGKHALNRGFGDAQRIMGGTRQIPIRLHDGVAAEVPFRFIPPFPDLPMEEIYVRQPATAPAAVARTLNGGGRVVYLPWNIGEVFWEVLNFDHSILIGNAIRWALGTRSRVEVTGPGVLDIATREGDGRLAVHLVNLTNPMMMKGPIREVIPVGKQTVSVALSAGCTKASARLLVSGRVPATRIEAGRLEIEVTEIAASEVVLIDLGA